VVDEATTPMEILVNKMREGASRGRKKGWYLRELRPKDQRENPRLTLDEKEQLWVEIQLMKAYVASQPKQSRSKTKRGKYKPTSATSKGPTVTYLVAVAYGVAPNWPTRLKQMATDSDGVVHSTLQVVRQKVKQKLKSDDDGGRNCVLENRELARKIYTAKHLYALNYCRKKAHEANCCGEKAVHTTTYKEASLAYEALDEDTVKFWEHEKRKHDAKQPLVKYMIIDAIKKNAKVSWQNLETIIGSWCSAETIRRWMCSFAGYKTYCERIIPLLSPDQKKKHLDFATHFRNNWGLGAGKYLLIMYDEKWFWGLVIRRGAKCCKELGIEQNCFSAYHKSHINKVMAIAFTAFAFEDCIENGGNAEKIAFIRAQGPKVAAKVQRACVRQADGRRKYCGDVIRNKGDIYDVDCAVTGSNVGTTDNPKCPLLPIFYDTVFPRVEKLVGPGGKYEGYTPVFQGDNAGPHQDAKYVKGVTDYCNQKGWHWEPQAPQMPHMNVLDLSVFPGMSRRHIEACRENSDYQVLPNDAIWKNADKVWDNLPNAKIASGYIHAYRMAEKVIKANGGNGFLGAAGSGDSGDGLHVGISKDFRKTDNGMCRADKQKVKPNYSNKT
jgi:hypothetical protein